MVRVKGFRVHAGFGALAFEFSCGVADRVIFSNGENIMYIAGDHDAEPEVSGADACSMHLFRANVFFYCFGAVQRDSERILYYGYSYRMALRVSSHGDCRGKGRRRGRGNGETAMGMSGDNEGSFFIACVHPI